MRSEADFGGEMTGAQQSGVDGVIRRIREIAAGELSHPDAGNLFHAYIACLSVPDLCRMITDTLAAPSKLRLALRRRLLRLLGDDRLDPNDRQQLSDSIERSRASARKDPAVRPAVEALLSAAFEFLAQPQQQSIIEAWIDQGTRGAAARWLKAVRQVPALFDETMVMAYYRSTGDERAARSLARQASPDFLAETLAELADGCEEGWIVSRAALRARAVADPVWPVIRSKHPATYLYLCARLRRKVTEAEALELVMTCPNFIMNRTRGLAVWAVGQMGMTAVLDEIVERGDELHRLDMEELERFPGWRSS
ncbi:hypothetical protein [Bradyrhizobium ottawaense]|uniref:hypothetical protein n=1 Tax=Bradyrhizobium ottawaense TaxID=931866 RepID=UPI003511B60B